jgi:hypothetical protein
MLHGGGHYGSDRHPATANSPARAPTGWCSAPRSGAESPSPTSVVASRTYWELSRDDCSVR